MTDFSKRYGNITSSEIVSLLSTQSVPMTDDELRLHLAEFPKSRKKNIDKWPGKAAITYLNQCNMERRLGRSLDSDIEAKPTCWGKFVEKLLFMLLDEEYTYNSSETLTHPVYDYWKGTPDGFKKSLNKTVIDTKCPYTLESFCRLVNPLYNGLEGIDAMNALRNGFIDNTGLLQPPHPDGDKFYWQLVSNGCISGSKYAELKAYCPYESELEAIKAAAVKSGDPSVYFIANASENSLPYIKDDGFYTNINTITFEIPESDKEFLTNIVKESGKYLI